MKEVNRKKAGKIVARNKKDLERGIALGLEKAERFVAKGVSFFLKKARFWIANFWKKASVGFTEFEHKAEKNINKATKKVKGWEHRAENNIKDLEQKAVLGLRETEGLVAFNVSSFLKKASLWFANMGQKISSAFSGSLANLKEIEHKAEEKMGKVAGDVKNLEQKAEAGLKDFGHKTAEEIKKVSSNVKDFEHKTALNVKKFAESVKHIRPQKKQTKEKPAEKPAPEEIIKDQPAGPAKKTSFANLFRKMEIANPMRILVVEDEEILAEVLKEKLQKANLTVQIAKDGEEAMSMAKSFEPQVIALDLMLPKVDGFEFLKQIKADDKLKRVPVIVISNMGDEENIKRAMSMGVADYFVKSNHPINEIVDKVKSVLLKSK